VRKGRGGTKHSRSARPKTLTPLSPLPPHLAQISVILHDECYLVHPHRLLTSTAVVDMRGVAAARRGGVAGGGINGGAGGGSAASASAGSAGTAQATAAAAAAASSSSSSSLGGHAAAGGPSAASFSAGAEAGASSSSSSSAAAAASAADASAAAAAEAGDEPLPPHLRSFEIFSRGLRVAPDVRDGRRTRAAPAPAPTASPSSSAPPAPAAPSPPLSPLEAALAEYEAARALLFPEEELGLAPAPEDVAALQTGDGLAAALSERRVGQGSAPLTPLQLVIVATASIVHARCFDPDTMSVQSKRSLYVRQLLAPPVLQSLVAAGVAQPRQLWHGASSLVRTVADVLHSHAARSKAAAAAAALAAAGGSSSASARGTSTPTRSAQSGRGTGGLTPVGMGGGGSVAGGASVGSFALGRRGLGPGPGDVAADATTSSSSSLVSHPATGTAATASSAGSGGAVSLVRASAPNPAVANIVRAGRSGTGVDSELGAVDGDNDDGDEDEDGDADDDGLSVSVGKGSVASLASLASLQMAAYRDAVGVSSSSLSPETSSSALRFLLEYTLRLLRWLTLREYAAHILYYKPHLAYSPGRPELAHLPWGNLPSADLRPSLSFRPQTPGRFPSSSGASGMSGAAGASSGAGGASSSSSSAGTAASASSIAVASSWWHTPTLTGPTSSSSSSSSILPHPILPSVSVTLPSLPTIPMSVPWAGALDSAEVALGKSLRAAYEATLSGPGPAAAFAAALSGYPLADAALVALESTGHAPPLLLPVIASLWCKHLGRPWHECMRWLLLRSTDADVPLAVLRWQWATGLGAGCDWNIPVDAPDVLSGYDLELSPPLERVEWLEDWEEALEATGSAIPAHLLPFGSRRPLGDTPSYPLQLLFRFHPRLPPHAHCMAHPASVEFAFQPDPSGAFVRMLLSEAAVAGSSPSSSHAFCRGLGRRLAVPRLSPLLPDGVVYEPSLTPPAILAAAQQTLCPAGDLLRAPPSSSSSRDGRYTFPSPITSLARSRERALECVLALHKHCKPKAGVFSVVNGVFNAAAATAWQGMGFQQPGPTPGAAGGGGAGGGAGAGGRPPSSPSLSLRETAAAASPATLLDARAHAFVAAQVAAGCTREWGIVAGWPLLTEEDGASLTASVAARKEDGWAEILDDPERLLKVFAQSRSDVAVKPHLATVAVRRHTDGEAYDAVAALSKYKQWDLSWATAESVARLDPTTEACYFIGDAPPSPYSYIITQRDFVLFRHSIFNAASRTGHVFMRTGAHEAHSLGSGGVLGAVTHPYIRAETVGVVGFFTRRMGTPPGLRCATQPTGERVQTPVPDAPRAPAALQPGRDSPSSLTAVLPSAAFTPPGVVLPPAAGATHLVLLAAGDPKGSIPSYLVNFVAKRTPRMWIERLSRFADKFREEDLRRAGE
jgi:hypothetical protein